MHCRLLCAQHMPAHRCVARPHRVITSWCVSGLRHVPASAAAKTTYRTAKASPHSCRCTVICSAWLPLFTRMACRPPPHAARPTHTHGPRTLQHHSLRRHVRAAPCLRHAAKAAAAGRVHGCVGVGALLGRLDAEGGSIATPRVAGAATAVCAWRPVQLVQVEEGEEHHQQCTDACGARGWWLGGG